jgi:hypothetical protein
LVDRLIEDYFQDGWHDLDKTIGAFRERITTESALVERQLETAERELAQIEAGRARAYREYVAGDLSGSTRDSSTSSTRKNRSPRLK